MWSLWWSTRPPLITTLNTPSLLLTSVFSGCTQTQVCKKPQQGGGAPHPSPVMKHHCVPKCQQLEPGPTRREAWGGRAGRRGSGQVMQRQ